MNTYQIDTAVTLSNLFTLADGVTPVDPTTVILYVIQPDGTENQYTGGELDHPSVGRFNYGVVASESGLWTYKWQGTGSVEVTSPDTFFIINPSLAIAG